MNIMIYIAKTFSPMLIISVNLTSLLQNQIKQQPTTEPVHPPILKTSPKHYINELPAHKIWNIE